MSEIEKLERRHAERPQGLTFASLAEAYRKTGDVVRALEVLGPGLATHPEYIPGSIVLGRCHLDLGDDAAAEQAFTTVLSLDPENVIALKALADITERAGRFGEAERWLNMLLAIDRGNDEAREQRARVEAALRSGGLPTQPPMPAIAEARFAPVAEPTPVPLAAVALPPAPDPEPPVEPSLAGSPPDLAEAAPSLEEPLIEPPPPTLEAAPDRRDPALSWPPMVREHAAPLTAPTTAEVLAIEAEQQAAREAWVSPAGAGEAVTPLAFTEFAAAAEEAPEVGAADMVREAEPIERADDLALSASTSNEFERFDASADLAAPVEAPVGTADTEPVAEEPAPAVPERSTPEAAAAAEVGGATDDGLDLEGAASSPAMVVTESMAELFVSQGHRGEAIRVYRELITRRPGDGRLGDRLAELEAAEVSAAAAAEAARPRYRAVETGGQSVASLFRRLLGAPEPSAVAAEPAPSYDDFFAPAGVAVATAPEAAPAAAEPGDSLAQFQSWLQQLKR